MRAFRYWRYRRRSRKHWAQFPHEGRTILDQLEFAKLNLDTGAAPGGWWL